MQSELELQFEGEYAAGPWFEFQEAGRDRPRWCQPDGLLFQPLYSTITIVEIKLQHTTEAWWQVKQLYLPVVATAFPPNLWRYNYCEIVKWHDPATGFPEAYRMVASPLALGIEQFGVHILSGVR